MKKQKKKKEKDPLSSVREAQSDLKANCKRSGNSLKRAVATKTHVCRESFNFLFIALCFTAFRKAFLWGWRAASPHGAACSASGVWLTPFALRAAFLFFFINRA